MANGMEGLFLGNSAIRTAQNAINTCANNLANVNTEGYVRQQVLMEDVGYNYFDTAHVSAQRMGLGVNVAEIVHARDIFLDKTYRQESGRQAYYDAYYSAIDEVQGLYQELDGEAFRDTLTGDSSLWTAFQQLAEDPSDTVNQNLIIQKSNLFLSRAQAIYSSLSTYQSQINYQINDDIDRINELGKQVYELNLQIQAIEASKVETAYDLRDARDLALDQLSALANISYSESSTGIVEVKLEGSFFIDEARFYEMGKQVDRSNGYITPYWPFLSNEENDDYRYVFDFSQGVSTDKNTDIGELKGLIQARGSGLTNYTAIHEVDPEKYYNTTGMSVMEESEAQLDQLIHGITSKINDIICPNKTASFSVKDTETGVITNYHNVMVLDTENCNTGSDGKLPPLELYTRVGCDRYTEVTATDGTKYYIYNTEDTYDTKTLKVAGKEYQVWDKEKGNGTVSYTRTLADGTVETTKEQPFSQWDKGGIPKYEEQFIGGGYYYVYNDEYSLDTATQYTLHSLGVNDKLEGQVNLFPYLTQKKEIDYGMGAKLSAVWEQQDMVMHPGSDARFTFSSYYTEMIGCLATAGSTYESTSTTLMNSVTAIDNQRSQVTGVSTDEELTNMIKYQNAYNAASRYVQAVTDMLDILVSSLG